MSPPRISHPDAVPHDDENVPTRYERILVRRATTRYIHLAHVTDQIARISARLLYVAAQDRYLARIAEHLARVAERLKHVTIRLERYVHLRAAACARELR